MMITRLTTLLLLTLSFSILLPVAALAQSVPFLLRAEQDATVAAVPNGASLTMAAASIGRQVNLSVFASYRGVNTASISRIELIGSSDFALLETPELPVNIVPNQEIKFTVRYAASTSDRVTTLALVTYTEVNQQGQTTASGLISLNFVGVAPDINLAYSIPTDNNVIPLSAGGAVLFPDTRAGTTVSATVSVLNRGSGPGNVKAVTLTGDNFRLIGLPLLPGLLDRGQEFRFQIRYAPLASGPSTGALTIEVEGRTFQISVQGNSVSPAFVYTLAEAESSNPLVPGQPFDLQDSLLGQVRSFVVVVRNEGTTEGQVTGAQMIGAGFQFTDAPFLPTLLQPGGAIFFGISFTPVQPGPLTGRLRIGNDTFELKTNVLGAKLRYAYSLGAGSFPVEPNGSLGFNPLDVGLSARMTVTVTNDGSRPANINSIVISTGPFLLQSLPPLPASLAPGASISFGMLFSPTAVGSSTALLRIDAQTFSVSGYASSRRPIPSFRYEGDGGVQPPMQQVAIGLTLSEPYQVDLKGTLNISFESDVFSIDPAVRFAIGGRTATFDIPAGTTRAVFVNNSNLVRLQTGTVAGTIVITPAFATVEGFNLTPDAPLLHKITLLPSSPRLLEANVVNRTSNGFVVQIVGYSTNRNLTKLDLEFSSTGKYRLPVTQFTLDLTAASALWYQGAPSQAFGGLFTLSVPFSLRTDDKTAVPIEAIQSVSATVSNDQGRSNSVAANL